MRKFRVQAARVSVCFGLLAGALGGCAGAPRLEPVGLGETGSKREVSGAAGRVRAAVTGASRDVGWRLAGPPSTRAAEDLPLAFTALLPDGRTAVGRVRSTQEADRQRVQIRVGRFGDPGEETRWLGALAARLARPAAPGRDRGFELPPWPDLAPATGGGP